MRIAVLSLCLILGIHQIQAGNRKFSSTSYQRHKEMQEYFQSCKEKKPSWTERKYLTGDWNGMRCQLAEKGITFSGTFDTDMLGNPLGGQSQGFAYVGSMGADMNIDFGTATNLAGWNFYISFVWRTGTNLSADRIKNAFNVAQLYGGMTWKLNNLYIKKVGLDERFVLKLGRLEQGNDFLCSPFYHHFVSNGIDGNPVGIFKNTPFFAYPNSTFGAYLEFKPLQRIKIQMGVYNANQDASKNKYHGCNFTFRDGGEGVMLITQWTYLHNSEKNDEGYPGNYGIGGLYVTGKTTQTQLPNKKGNYLLYAMIDQMIYRKEPARDQGITPFIALLFAPKKDRNLFPFFLSSGITFKGLIAKREEDVIAVGVVYGKYSSDLRAIQRQQRLEGFNIELQDAETVVEANYRIQINPWFYFQPDFQYIITPSGTDSISNAFVLGLQSGLIF